MAAFIRSRWALPADWLFPGQNPGRPLTTRTVQKACRRALEAAGLGAERRITVHTLRHSFATHLFPDGLVMPGRVWLDCLGERGFVHDGWSNAQASRWLIRA